MPENVESPAALLKTKEPTIRLKKAELNKELLKVILTVLYNGSLTNCFRWIVL